MADFADRFDAKVAEGLKVATRAAPYSSLLGLVVEQVTPGEIVIALPVRPELGSGIGAVRSGTLRAVGKVLSLRTRLAVVRVDVECEGKQVATALGTVTIKERPKT